MSSLLSDFRRLALVGLAAGCPALAPGQTTLALQGPQSYLSGGLAADQMWPSVGMTTNGGWVVWQDNAMDHHGWGIGARRLDENGEAMGPPFQVNQVATQDQERPAVATLQDGGAVFVWQGGPVGFQMIQARFMNAAGSFVTGDVPVTQALQATTNRVTLTCPVFRNNRSTIRRFRATVISARRFDFGANPVAAQLANGDVLIAYAGHLRFTTNAPVVMPEIRIYGSQYVTNSILPPLDLPPQDCMQDVFVRRYTAGGLPLGDEFRANQFTPFHQRNPALAPLANGNFVLVWVSENQGLTSTQVAQGRYRQDIYARLFNAAGVALGNEFLVNDPAAAGNTLPTVGAVPGGGFRVAWTQASGSASDGLDVVTRLFDANGSAASQTARVNTYTLGDQYGPRLASCPAGEIIVWTSLHQDGSAEGVHGQWFSGGAAAGAEFRVNAASTWNQSQPSVSASAANQIVVGWAGFSRSTGFDILGQRYSASNP